MAYLKLYGNREEENNFNKKIVIMIFTEGTILGPKSVFEYFNCGSYIPVKNSVSKIKSWKEQGAEILYFTSRKNTKEVSEIKEILSKYNFPGKYLYYREKGQKYKDIIESIIPDILIEDDCRSIGGKWQMCITNVNREIKRKINSIVVEEFGGIDYLPSSISDLLIWNPIDAAKMR